MQTHSNGSQEHKNESSAAAGPQTQGDGESTFQFIDNRPEAIAQRKLQEIANNSSQATQLQAIADNYSSQQQHSIQTKENNEVQRSEHGSANINQQAVQRVIDKDNNTALTNLTELNNALFKLNPQITGVSLSMFQVPGANNTMLNLAIQQNNSVLYDSMKRKDVLDALRIPLTNLVNNHPSTYNYDPHGAKHFPGGPAGTKFTAGSGVVNPQLVALIQPEIGRIRRDARGNNQSYYFTAAGIAQCGNSDLTIQVDFDFASDSITYHGYPDNGVVVYALSRTKNGAAI